MIITQAAAHRFTSNDLLAALRARPRSVNRMQGKYGPIYSLSEPLVRLPAAIVERQISKGILEPRDGGFVLSAQWGGR